MKLQELFETKISNEQLVIRWIQEHCPNNFSALMAGRTMPLWRSTKLIDPMYVDEYCAAIMQERISSRQSQTGVNLIMNYVSLAKAWDKYPKRNTSTSCTPDIAETGQFAGDTCLIIPFDDVKNFASCTGDFNYIIPKGTSSELLDIMGTIMDIATEESRAFRARPLTMSDNLKKLKNVLDSDALNFSKSHTFSLDDINDLSDAIEKTIYLLDNLEPSEFKGMSALKDLKNSCDKFEDELDTRSLNEFLSTKITPKNMGVKSFNSYADIKVPKDSEIWFNGHYIAITGDHGDNQTSTLVSSPFLRKLHQKI